MKRAMPRPAPSSYGELASVLFASAGVLVALTVWKGSAWPPVVLSVLGCTVGALVGVVFSLITAQKKTNRHPQVFISYERSDHDFARQLAAELAEIGARPILDRDALRVGDNVSTTLNKLIGSSDYIVLIASEASRSSQWVETELKEALKLGKRVLPVLTNADALPPELRDVYYADFTENRQQGLAELKQVIRGGLSNPL
jgi:TIR domain